MVEVFLPVMQRQAAPYQPVEVQPKPASLAIPPSHGPKALAMLKAE